jgi:hypothetical protein
MLEMPTLPFNQGINKSVSVRTFSPTNLSKAMEKMLNPP